MSNGDPGFALFFSDFTHSLGYQNVDGAMRTWSNLSNRDRALWRRVADSASARSPPPSRTSLAPTQRFTKGDYYPRAHYDSSRSNLNALPSSSFSHVKTEDSSQTEKDGTGWDTGASPEDMLKFEDRPEISKPTPKLKTEGDESSTDMFIPIPEIESVEDLWNFAGLRT